MSLLLEHRWEHALIGAVVEAAKAASPSCYLGRTAIQKLVYFLHVSQVPMRFSFRIHHFGPYCDDLAAALEWLQADNVVCDKSENPRYSDFVTGVNWREVKQRFRTQLDKHEETIRSVAEALGSMDPNTLELIATLDYSFRWIQARGGNGPFKERTIEKFKAIKGDKFSDAEVEKWHSRLVSSKLIEP